MVVKQVLQSRCRCGQALQFPEAQVMMKCRCGRVWELGTEGFWSNKFVTHLGKLKADTYPRYPRRGKRKRRKGGRR